MSIEPCSCSGCLPQCGIEQQCSMCQQVLALATGQALLTAHKQYLLLRQPPLTPAAHPLLPVQCLLLLLACLDFVLRAARPHARHAARELTALGATQQPLTAIRASHTSWSQPAVKTSVVSTPGITASCKQQDLLQEFQLLCLPQPRRLGGNLAIALRAYFCC
jgi:hypothetical protein